MGKLVKDRIKLADIAISHLGNDLADALVGGNKQLLSLGKAEIGNVRLKGHLGGLLKKMAKVRRIHVQQGCHTVNGDSFTVMDVQILDGFLHLDVQQNIPGILLFAVLGVVARKFKENLPHLDVQLHPAKRVISLVERQSLIEQAVQPLRYRKLCVDLIGKGERIVFQKRKIGKVKLPPVGMGDKFWQKNEEDVLRLFPILANGYMVFKVIGNEQVAFLYAVHLVHIDKFAPSIDAQAKFVVLVPVDAIPVS